MVSSGFRYEGPAVYAEDGKLLRDGGYCCLVCGVVNTTKDDAVLHQAEEHPPTLGKQENIVWSTDISPELAGYVSVEEIKTLRNSLMKFIEPEISEVAIHQHLAGVLFGVLSIPTPRLYSFGNDMKIYNSTVGTWNSADFIIPLLLSTVYNFKKAGILEIIYRLEYLSQANRTDFDAVRKKYIGLKNGTWDIAGWCFVPHSPSHHLITTLPVIYDASAECPKVLKFFSEIVAHEDVPLLAEWAGYCLIDSHFIHKALMLRGDGSNGKSVFIQLITAMLGENNIASIPLQTFANNRFAGAEIYGKKANLSADISDSALKDASMFKILVSGDTVSVERKFKDPFAFANTCKLIFSANTIPRTADITGGFFRRWCIISFPNLFEGANCDLLLIDKLKAPSELSGFLNIALGALKNLIETEHFSNPQGTDAIKLEYMGHSDSISAFCQLAVVEDEHAESLPTSRWYMYYSAFCQMRRIRPAYRDVFCKKLPTLIMTEDIFVRILNDDNKQHGAWAGITPSSSFLKEYENRHNRPKQKTLEPEPEELTRHDED